MFLQAITKTMKIKLGQILHKHVDDDEVRGLDLVHGGDVAGLDVVLEVCDLLLKLVDGDLLVLNDAENLKNDLSL